MKKIMLFLCAGALLATQSCKKDDKNDTAASKSDMLKGTWTLSQYGADANNNGTLDNGEAVDASLAGISGTTTFNNDGTGSSSMKIMGDDGTESFKWFIESDKTLKMVDGDNDTTSVTIAELTSSRFVSLSKNELTSTNVWSVWKK